MPKKSKRQTRKTSVASPEEVIVEATSNVASSSSRSFNPDYSYVIKDLKRIAILAGIFFGILIILSFIL
jgi:hypothetical protein